MLRQQYSSAQSRPQLEAFTSLPVDMDPVLNYVKKWLRLIAVVDLSKIFLKHPFTTVVFWFCVYVCVSTGRHLKGSFGSVVTANL